MDKRNRQFPDICILAGLAGTGKTTATELLAAWLRTQNTGRKACVIDQDDLRAQLAEEWRQSGLLPKDAAIPTSRTHPEFTSQVYSRLWQEIKAKARTGAWVLVAASFKNPDNQEEFAQLWPELSKQYDAAALWLYASRDIAVARTLLRQKDPNNKSDQSAADVARQYETAAAQKLMLAAGWRLVSANPPGGVNLETAPAQQDLLQHLLEAIEKPPSTAPQAAPL